MNSTAPAARPVYPFSALVGQPQMRLALLLHAVHPGLGGVLVRGEKGTAKSTAVRALAALLPEIDAVTGCAFGCDPTDPSAACDDCAALFRQSTPLPAIRRPVPVVELPIGATEDRVLGSLDLEAAIQSGTRRFEPGLLARANRGILYVDEVNLLADHLVDLLLDAAAMGRNYVEREAISFSHPACFMLIGTMNPEEGELRPQLLDRFALTVEVESLRDPAERAEAVVRRIAFERDPRAFGEQWAESQAEERARLTRARAALPGVRVPSAIVELISRICAGFAVDGLRADLAIYRAASALAAYERKPEVDADDIRRVAAMALGHRRRRQPFDDPGLNEDELDRLIGEHGETADGGSSGSREERETLPSDHAVPSYLDPKSELRSAGGSAQARLGDRISQAAPGSPLALELPRLKPKRHAASGPGRRTAVDRGEVGPSIGSSPAHRGHFELALAATLRAAAPFQISRRTAGQNGVLCLRPSDLRERVRRGRTSALAVFAVDASGSMGARNRMALAKSAVIGLLLDAYRRRDRVALIAFRGLNAEVLLPPTNSVQLAEKRLRVLPTGGRTPLAAGLRLAGSLFEQSRNALDPNSRLLVVVSDGRANVGNSGEHPWQGALSQAERIRKMGATSIFLDTEKSGMGTGLGRTLAHSLGARYLALNSNTLGGRTGVDA